MHEGAALRENLIRGDIRGVSVPRGGIDVPEVTRAGSPGGGEAYVGARRE